MISTVRPNDRSWAASPCSSCQTSPCCTRLPLSRFHIERRSDFERARATVCYPGVEVGLYDSGWWMVYYLAPCRFLNPLDSKCLVHRSEHQPAICRDYSPVRCWYKRIFVSGVSPDFIRFDADRFHALETMIVFDEAGELAAVASWDELQAALALLPLRGPGGRRPDGKAITDPPPGLVFPIRTPRTRRDLDVMRFRLGFHGVRIGIADESWVTIIGNPPDISRFVVLSYDQIDDLHAAFVYDEAGAIIGAPRWEKRDAIHPE